jgi:hypothetical protein
MIPRHAQPRRATRTWIGESISTTDGASFDFGDFVIPNPGLLVIGLLADAPGGSTDCNSLTVGGDSAQDTFTENNMVSPGHFFVKKSGAGTFNVSATFDDTVIHAGVGVWLVEDFPANDLDGKQVGFPGLVLWKNFYNDFSSSDTSATFSTGQTWAQGLSFLAEIHRNTNASTWAGATVTPTTRHGQAVETNYMSWADVYNPADTDLVGDVSVSWSGAVRMRAMMFSSN